MPVKRDRPFAPPAPEDVRQHPTQILNAPKGGHMWKCHYCARPASHLTQNGLKVCKAHGGSTANQRDPEYRARSLLSTGSPVRPPGRPIKHGYYSIIPGQRIDQLVDDYRAQQLNPDATEDDMYYLRAYLDELKRLRPDATTVEEALRRFVEALPAFEACRTELMDDTAGRPLTMREALDTANLYGELTASTAQLAKLLSTLLRISEGVEDRHARLITLAKIRAETRVKNVAAEEAHIFQTMVSKLQVLLVEVVPSEYMTVLYARMAKELNEVPGRADNHEDKHK